MHGVYQRHTVLKAWKMHTAECMERTGIPNGSKNMKVNNNKGGLGSGIVKEVEHEHMARRIVMYCTCNRHAYLAKQVQKTKPTNIVEEKDDAADF